MSNLDERVGRLEEFRPLLVRLGFDPNRVDSVLHALADIEGSTEKIYHHLLPALLNARDLSDEELRDRLWGVREEFRHLDYHVHDGQLTEL